MSTKRSASTITAMLAGFVLTAGSAAANAETYESAYLDDDAEVYDFYDAGFDDIDENDDWFYDYYEYDTDLGTEVSTVGDDVGFDYDLDVGDGDATDLGGDDAGEEGLLDF